jgi:hypothetical protein
LEAIGLAWRGVNHQRLPVDAIVIDQMWVCVAMDGWCQRMVVLKRKEMEGKGKGMAIIELSILGRVDDLHVRAPSAPLSGRDET